LFSGLAQRQNKIARTYKNNIIFTLRQTLLVAGQLILFIYYVTGYIKKLGSEEIILRNPTEIDLIINRRWS
jgi:hypothetical protein